MQPVIDTQKHCTTPESDVSEAQNVFSRFDTVVKCSPSHSALVDEEHDYSYEQLSALIDSVQVNLVNRGLRSGDKVLVGLTRSSTLVIVLMGIMRAGMIAIPVNKQLPESRLQSILDDTKPDAVIVDNTDNFSINDVPLISPNEVVGYDASTTLDSSSSNYPSDNDIAYILFTSGSTGKPKGVAMPYAGLNRLVGWQIGDNAGCCTNTLQFSPIIFDVSFQEIYSTLAEGGTLYIIPEEKRLDPPALLRYIDRFDIQRLYVPYVILQRIAEAACQLEIFPQNLKRVISSGEQLKVTEDIRVLFENIKDSALENQYGPTESHVVTRHVMQGAPSQWPNLPPIGKPIADSHVVLLDAQRKCVALGMPGEIYLSGRCLAAGYKNNRTLTAERFVDISLPDKPKQRFYKTGDIGIQLPGGSFIYLGRSDAQVKVRGHRVELGEIEVNLLSYSVSGEKQFSEVAVVSHGLGQQHQLVAYVVSVAEATVDYTLVKHHLRQHIPDYMIPGRFVSVEALPQTPSGKVDVKSLSEREIAQAPTVEYVAPSTDLEQQICVLVSKVLQRDKIGIHDDFFDIGGDSIVAMRLVALFEKELSLNIPLSTFLTAPTVQALANHIVLQGDRTAGARYIIPLKKGDSRLPPLFLIHPIGGTILCYSNLVKHLNTDRVVYGIQAPGVEGDEPPIDSINKLACFYADEIKKIRPDGDCLLAGWSFGGFAALEVARLLHERGSKIENVILIDSIMLGEPNKKEVSDELLEKWFVWDLLGSYEDIDSPESLPGYRKENSVIGMLQNIYQRLPLSDVITSTVWNILTLERHSLIATMVNKAKEEGRLPEECSAEMVEKLFKVFKAHWNALMDYKPTTVTFPITLLKAKEPLPSLLNKAHKVADSQHNDPFNGWRKVTSAKIDVHHLPGDHLGIMIPPNVTTLGHTLTDIIEFDKASAATSIKTATNASPHSQKDYRDFALKILGDIPLVGQKISTTFAPRSTDGAVVLIADCSTELGKEVALNLAAKQLTVYAGVRSESEAQCLQIDAPNTLHPIVFDVTNTETVKAAKRVLEEEGRLDLLINNSWVGTSSSIECLKLDELRMQYEVCVIGNIGLTQAMIPLLQASKGKVVNMNAGLGKLSSAAINESLRRELLPLDIHVSALTYDKSPKRNPQDVASQLYGILKSPHPKARYSVGSDALIEDIASRLLPRVILDFIP